MNALLVDDHAMFRVGIRLLLGNLRPNLQVSEAGSIREASQRLASPGYLCSIIFLDLNLPDAKGMNGFQTLHALRPDIPICVLSAEEDPQLVRRIVDAGAFSFIHKSAAPAELSNALNSLLSGGAYLPSSALAETRSAGYKAPTVPPITDRQRDVLALLIRGQSNKVIAKQLGISDTTVKSHVDALFNAFDASNRTEVVYAVAKLGLF